MDNRTAKEVDEVEFLMSVKRIQLGRWGEIAALKHLEGLGMKLVQQNYRCPFGEMDLIMREKDTLVFVEVRTRSSKKFGLGQESINKSKLLRLRRIASCYLNQISPAEYKQIRIDLVAIFGNYNEIVSVDHITGI